MTGVLAAFGGMAYREGVVCPKCGQGIYEGDITWVPADQWEERICRPCDYQWIWVPGRRELHGDDGGKGQEER